MAASLQFLDLPSELILACITPLHYKDLISCLNTRNRLLYNIIVNSILVQYGLEQHLARVEENPSQTENVVISDRLSDLRRREADWLNFTPRSRHTLTVDFVTTGIYDLTSEIYLLGDTPDQITSICTAIKYIFTSPEVDAAQWHRVDGGKPVIDFGTALEEHDLIAMVTYTQHPGNPHMRSVDIQLLKFSTGHPHPQAAQPTLHIQDVNILIGRPGISIEIVAENLAISMVYWDYEGRDMDTLHIYNWLTEKPKTAPLIVNNTGLIFLTTDTLIIPNAVDASLDVYRITESEDAAPPHFLSSFCLPVESGILSFQCRGEPNPRAARTRPSRARFLPRTDSAILLFSFEVENDTEAPTECMLVVDRVLFRAIALHSTELITPWSAWGPPCTRWLDPEAVSMQCITTTCGMRLVTIAPDAWQRPAPVRILDFNPAHVQAQRRAEPSDRVRVVEADTVEHAVVRAPFTEPIVSRLPYVDSLSEELFPYGAVLINYENILGVKFSDSGAVEELEVLHFG